MAISNELMLAILAMDSYNRGYNAGIVGPNGNTETGLGLTGQIGTATVNADPLPTGSIAASFYAQSYTYNGQTVISYRGTDASVADAWTGYGVHYGHYGDMIPIV